MKGKLFFLSVFAVLFTYGVTAQNLIVDGDMEKSLENSAWTVAGFSSSEVAEWEYETDKPAAGSGKVLHIAAAQPSVQVQYAIYQSVNLIAGVSYTVDAAVKITGSVRQGWFEFYIGTPDPAGLTDYSVPNGTAIGVTASGITKIAGYFSWWADGGTPSVPDGTLQTGANQKATFVPTATGAYYFLLKAGCSATTGNFDILLDNVTLIPQPAILTAGSTMGTAPFTVQFSTNMDFNSYAWNFDDPDSGDSNTSTSATPVHVFNNPGTYVVSLVTDGNTASPLQKTINVFESSDPSDGELLRGGNMESADPWMVTFLDGNAPAGSEAELTWNYTENTPARGTGGALRINGGSYRHIVALYQPVDLVAGKSYKFDMALKALISMNSFWAETYYLYNETPTEGAKLSVVKENGGSPGFINHDANYNGPIQENWDVRFSEVAYTNPLVPLDEISVFKPVANGTCLFVLKIGTHNAPLDIVIDELSLKEISGSSITKIEKEKPAMHVQNRSIQVTTESGSNVIAIYNAAAQLMETGKYTSSRFISKTLPSGLYIVNVNGKIAKALVK